MCGIAGEVRFDGRTASPSALAAMTRALARRGPDAEGLLLHGRAGLGHRRLRILDLSERAQQPMTDAALGLTLVFNGCIYNFKQLRTQLEARGYRFVSASDSEVILKAYHAWGPQCVERLNGMFAFAILERDSGRLVLARDRLGIKPLYLSRSAGKLRFASTPQALLAAGGVDTQVDPVALHHYMHFHAVVPAPRTLLSGIRKLEPATVLEVDADGTERERRYWQPTWGGETEELSDEDWESRVLESLRLAVERRLVADVPLGVLLSGGVDSSLVVALLAEAGKTLETFSIGFEGVDDLEGDEFRYSDAVAERFGTRHHKIPVGARECLDLLPNSIAAQAEPMVSHDVIGFYLLAREVSRHVKVVESGQGADEVFAGYHWYPPLADSTDPVSDYARVFFDRDHQDYAALIEPGLVNGDASRRFVGEHFGQAGATEPLDKALRLDTTVMLVDDPVKRVDNMTMAWGLEARVPFLDHELVELAARVPGRLKLAEGGKGVLKRIARRFLPAQVVDRPKGYFPVPALKNLGGPYLEMVKDTLESRRCRERGLYRRPYIEALYERPEALTPLGGSRLWQVGMLELWLQSQGL